MTHADNNILIKNSEFIGEKFFDKILEQNICKYVQNDKDIRIEKLKYGLKPEVEK